MTQLPVVRKGDQVVAKNYPKKMTQEEANKVANALQYICQKNPKLIDDQESFYKKANDLRGHPEVKPLWDIIDSGAEKAIERIKKMQFQYLVKTVSWEIIPCKVITGKPTKVKSSVRVEIQKRDEIRALPAAVHFQLNAPKQKKDNRIFAISRLERCCESLKDLSNNPEIGRDVTAIIAIAKDAIRKIS